MLLDMPERYVLLFPINVIVETDPGIVKSQLVHCRKHISLCYKCLLIQWSSYFYSSLSPKNEYFRSYASVRALHFTL